MTPGPTLDTCTYCQGQTATGIYLCKLCVTRLEEVLNLIEDALEVADDTIAKQDRMGASVASGTTDSPAPLNLDTMEKRRALWDALVSNAREVLEHDDNDDLRGVAPLTYLRLSTDLIARQDFAARCWRRWTRPVRSYGAPSTADPTSSHSANAAPSTKTSHAPAYSAPTRVKRRPAAGSAAAPKTWKSSNGNGRRAHGNTSPHSPTLSGSSDNPGTSSTPDQRDAGQREARCQCCATVKTA
ncbi:hypothetical protein [Nesterenkonia pannonica]|uniref:hypothetical protein n=1 Tax=Nesterenkonia pannonica TaxID=1548602 RepID=UPI0021644BE7|nr:hypothetical protein [Nesterenkonia pannonica]